MRSRAVNRVWSATIVGAAVALSGEARVWAAPAHAGERAELLKKMHPDLNIHIVNGCKHMVHWDAFDDLMRLGVPFLKS